MVQVKMCNRAALGLYFSLFVSFSLWAMNACAGDGPSAPSEFTERAASPFFYSIGRDLKHGDAIREAAPTLLRAGPSEVLSQGLSDWVRPSPDQSSAMALVAGRLYLVRPGQPVLKLLEHVADWDFSLGQWGADSRHFFMPMAMSDRAGDPRQKQQTVLLRMDVEHAPAFTILIPAAVFRMSASGFFPVGAESACFNTSPNGRDVVLRCWTGGQALDATEVQADRIRLTDGSLLAGPFVSHRPAYGGEVHLTAHGFAARVRPDSHRVEIFHARYPDRALLQLEGSVDPLKGRFLDGVSWNSSSVLPGGRYAFIDLRSAGKKVLLDSETGAHKLLPMDTQVWVNFNSRAYPGALEISHQGGGYFLVGLKSSPPLYRSQTR